MNIILNQQPQHIDVSAVDVNSAPTIADLISQLNQDKPGIAVAKNQAIIARSNWGQTPVIEGDRIDIFSVIAGG